jgi:glycosyltransferase involved in cell wall biosynthesis
MKLLYLTPTSIFAGGERITLGIAAAMRERGHEVHYCGLEGPIRDFVEAAGVSFVPLEKFTPWAVRVLTRKLRPDIIHAMDFRASLYAALSGSPFIAHLHNNPPWQRRYGANSLAMLFFGRRAGKIITVSKSVLEEYVFAGAIKNNTLLLGNTVNVQAVREQSQSDSYGAVHDVGFIGRLVEQKQPLVFIDIVARLRGLYPALRALLIGEGELRPAVENAITVNNLENSVTLAGFMPNPFPALAGCKVIIMPSAWEGFGLTAVEGMALGKPVLAAPVGGLKDIVDERCGKLCGTVTEFVDEAAILLTNPELYAQKSRAAREQAERYADNAGYYDRIEVIYNS